MNFTTIIGVLASILTASSLIPQLTKVLKEKKSESVSIVMLLVLISGVGLWVYYGILKEDFIIIISNSFAVLVNVLTLCLTIRYKKN